MRPASVLAPFVVLAAAYTWYIRSDYHRRGNRLFYRQGRPNRLGRAVAALWSAMAGLGMPPSFLVSLETTGYRTGQRRAIPVVVAEYGGERYIVSMLGERSPWVRNIRAADGRAFIKHGQRREVHLAELPPGERAPVMKAYLARAIDARPHFPVAWDAPIEAFDQVAYAYPVFRIEAAYPSGTGKFEYLISQTHPASPGGLDVLQPVGLSPEVEGDYDSVSSAKRTQGRVPKQTGATTDVLEVGKHRMRDEAEDDLIDVLRMEPT